MERFPKPELWVSISKTLLLTFSVFLLSVVVVVAQALPKRALTFDHFIDLDTISDPGISPDGQWVAFVVTDYSLQDNRGNSDIWIASVQGGSSHPLTHSPHSDNQPRWMSDSRRLVFTSSRDGTQQVYVITIDGGEARKISSLKAPISNLLVSPDDQWIAFSSDLDWPASGSRTEDPYPTEAKVWDDLLYRHWDEWRSGKRSHLFTMPLAGGGIHDLTPLDRDVPTLALGGYRDIAFAPEGKSIAVVMNADAVPAIGTNNDIFLVSVDGDSMANLTEANPANDNNPVFSPDGRWMAYRSQTRAGFESDRYHLMLYDRDNGTVRDLTPEWTFGMGEIVWASDSKSLYATVQREMRNAIYRISVGDGRREIILRDGHYQTPRVSSDGHTLVYTKEASNQPDEIYATHTGSGRTWRLSNVNGERVARLEMNSLEEFHFPGAKGEAVQGLLLRPPFFESTRKYPLIYLIHGGPQGAWMDSFHPRWNYQMFAATGYVVAMVNFHGSTGYGQDFTDSISGHWGDYPYEDVMKGLDHVLSNYSFVDEDKIAAAGASYGGYMINWIAAHTDRFVCLVNHDGVFNLESMYGETEELWFPEWEFGGSPWRNRELYRKWSPHNFAQNLKTPMLIIHGQSDYRVDVSQGLEAFTALRRQGVRSRFLYFPDEGHWVVKPRNRRLWWQEVVGWIDEYLKSD